MALKITEYQKNKENPFVQQAVEQIQKNIVKKYKSTNSTNKKALLTAVDENGEVVGHTQFIKQIELDEMQFAKMYLSGFKAFFDLTPAAIKVFGYILTVLMPNKDYFYFNREDCLEYTSYKSDASIFRGLAQLLENDVIARGKTDYIYFINPMICFNGNRVTFAKTYIRKQSKQIEKDTNQIQLDFSTDKEDV